MIILGKLITKSENIGGYIDYVFENLNSTDVKDKYVMCTQCPNWQSGIIAIGDRGFVTYEIHLAGADKWYNNRNNCMTNYKSNMVQFMKFIPENNTDNDNNTITL